MGNNKPSIKYETVWGNPETTEEMIRMVADAGFNVIRIPVTWGQHQDLDYTIDGEWMDRVQTIVDWSLNAGMKVILNMHHDTGSEGWLRADTSRMESQTPRFVRTWGQICERFGDYDDRLAFEAFNELLDSDSRWNDPTEDACRAVNQLNQIFVDTVRASGKNNAERVLLCTTYAAAQEEGALSRFELPKDTAEHCLIA